MATSSFYRIRKKEKNFEFANTVVTIASIFNIFGSAYGIFSYVYNLLEYHHQTQHLSEEVIGGLTEFLDGRFLVAYSVRLILGILIFTFSVRNFFLLKNGKPVSNTQSVLGVVYILAVIFTDVSFGWNFYGLIFPSFYSAIYFLSYLTASQVNQLND